MTETLKKQPIYILRVRAVTETDDYNAVGYYSRIPTLDEYMASLLDEIPANEEYRPGFTEAIGNVVMRSGFPLPPSGSPVVASTYEYPDGRVRVEFAYFYTLDEPGDTPK